MLRIFQWIEGVACRVSLYESLTNIVRDYENPPVRSAGILVEPALRAGIAPREPAGTIPNIKN